MQAITDSIYLIRGPFFEFPFCHCLVVKDDRSCLIDTAMLPQHLRELKDNFHIDLILNTHGHLDHANQNAEFSQPVYVHSSEAIWMESLEGVLEAFGFTGFGEYELGKEFIEWGRWRKRKPDGYFNPGDIINLGKNRIEVLHLPGHTPGHCGFFFLDEGILFSGDIDLTDFGPYYGNPVSNLDDFIDTLERLIELQPDLIITGHGEGVIKRNIRQRLRCYRDIIFRREEELLCNLCRVGSATLPEIAQSKVIYGKYKNVAVEQERLYTLMEKYMDLHHLNRLTRLGKVVQEGPLFIAG